MPTEERRPNERETQNSAMQCDLAQCSASPNERRTHVPQVRFGAGIVNKTNPNDIIYTASWPTVPGTKAAHSLEISTLRPKNLPLFQFLAMAKAASASGFHPLHTFTLVQVEAECTVEEPNKGNKERVTLSAPAPERDVVIVVTATIANEQMDTVRAEYRDRYNEFKTVINFLVERVAKTGNVIGCRRITRDKKQKRLEQALQEVETSFNLNLPL